MGGLCQVLKIPVVDGRAEGTLRVRSASVLRDQRLTAGPRSAQQPITTHQTAPGTNGTLVGDCVDPTRE